MSQHVCPACQPSTTRPGANSRWYRYAAPGKRKHCMIRSEAVAREERTWETPLKNIRGWSSGNMTSNPKGEQTGCGQYQINPKVIPNWFSVKQTFEQNM